MWLLCGRTVEGTKKTFRNSFLQYQICSRFYFSFFFIRLTIGPQSDLCKQLAKGTLKGKELTPYSFETRIHTSLYLGRGTVMHTLRQSVKEFASNRDRERKKHRQNAKHST